MPCIDFSDKTVWVTGAGKGIGYATALAFVDAGARVIGFDREFTQENYPFATKVMDVADAAQVAQVCQRVLQKNAAAGCAGQRRRYFAYGSDRCA
ncbi:2,3-dihydroxybenzoate-2,3-dehydrogenase [Salmonella enterica subsp. enterica serovar Agona str. 0322]|nr:2,3-dihydroxybenzoate-2,3-dehydrogenase [Salmonella enterica subsp. enterica serovar Agona str. 0322]